jgi:methionyl-tRNA formyltransferase
VHELRIVFFGSPRFSLPSLQKLNLSPHKIVGVVTQPDKIGGRGKKRRFTDVKNFALGENISPILQPVSLKEIEFIQTLQKLNADIFVVVAFRILPPEVFMMPSFGTINLHPSLLPKYRGAAPLNWTIINGEQETGITIIKISQKVDAGGILLQEKRKIFSNETVGSLHDRLSQDGADLLLKSIDLISENRVIPHKQDDTKATPAPKIKPEMCHLSFQQSADQLNDWIRGLSPYPGGYVYYNSERIKFLLARVFSLEESGEKPGTIISIKDYRLIIACQRGRIEILELQREGKKRLSTKEFLKGFSFNEGDYFL